MLSTVRCRFLRACGGSSLGRRCFSWSPAAFSEKVFTRNETVGFIGLGQMGFKMANNLYRKSRSPMIIYDTNPDTLTRFKALQETISESAPIQFANTPQQVAEKAATVITMLPDSPHVQQVYLGTEGLLAAIDKDSFFIESSTIDQSVAKEVIKQIFEKGGRAVDAPVSGGVVGAEAATLTFMVGAQNPEDFQHIKPLLSHMGKNIVHCGKPGTGQIAKMCNNMLLAISMIGVSEAMNLGIKLGMDPQILANIFNSSSGRCWSSDTYNPVPGLMPNVPSSRGYTGGFGNRLIAKDLKLAVKAANESKQAVFLGALAQQLYNHLSRTKKYEELDFSSVYWWLSSDEKE